MAFFNLPFSAFLHGLWVDTKAETANHAFFFLTIADSLTVADGTGKAVPADGPDAGSL